MTMKIPVSQEMVKLALELERYYGGDLEYCDSAKWLEDTKRLNRQLAHKARCLILQQAALGMSIYHDYDRSADCEYWYVAAGRDGRVAFKSLNRSDCEEWVQAQMLGAALD